MNDKVNLFCIFLGGVAVGAMSTYGIMKKMGYSRLEYDENGNIKKLNEEEEKEEVTPQSIKDKPSYEMPEKVDTQKTRYHTLTEKPALEELSKKYQSKSFDQHFAEREHPEEDEDDDEEELQSEIAEALMDHTGKMEDEIFDTDGYGHVLKKLASERKDSEIYLIPEEYAGEIYPIEDLVYFEKDDVLCDVLDAPVDDPDRIIGSALSHFGECGEEVDKVYVRNVNTGFEYEITKVDKAYAAHLYGVTDEEVALPNKGKTPIHPSKKRKQKLEEKDDEE